MGSGEGETAISKAVTSLSEAVSRREQPPLEMPVAVAPRPGGKAIRKADLPYVMVRLEPEALDQIEQLVFEQRHHGPRVTKQSLMVEALNDLFRKHGKPPIAG